MLHKLTIYNYAIIDKLDIEFGEHMNVITGETGAGKSILLGALSLILGERADTKVLYQADAKCVVEAHFEIEQQELKPFFANNELDFDTHTIIRREINQSGKSRAFINDTPVTLQVLKQLGEQLVNLHNQHETLELTKAGFQLQVIDVLAGNQKLLADYRQKFALYRKQQHQLDKLEQEYRSRAAELDYIRFQFNELAEAQLKAGEQTTLEAEQSALSNVEDIKHALTVAIQAVTEGETSILDRMAEVQSRLKSVKHYHKDILALSERWHSVYEELKDIGNEFENIQEKALLDPERLEEVSARLNTLYRLQKKHAVSTVEELQHIQTDLDTKMASVNDNANEIDLLKKQLGQQFSELLIIADKLHSAREKVLREFQNNVVVLLSKVGMPNSTFKVDIQKCEPHLLNEQGLTEIRFLFSANKGFAAQEIKTVASGGELSRLMLCIKSLIAEAGALPTMIFDEIDTGISGEVALKVGEIMKKLSRHHQLITITHLPQIAKAGDKHLYIYKQTTEHKTRTIMKELTGEERIIEIAKMLSGDKLSDASLANARELIAN